MPYTELDRQLGRQLRESLSIAKSPSRFDGNGEPSSMDYVAAAHRLVEELRRHDVSAYHAALRECATRYINMQEMAPEKLDVKLFKFTLDFQRGCVDRMSVPKLCRWLGYIQGLLIERGFTTVEVERDWSRPLFRPLDYPEI